MDIATSASSISQAQTGQQVSVAVLKKTLDAQKQEGAAALELLQSAADAAAQQNQPSGSIDVTA